MGTAVVLISSYIAAQMIADITSLKIVLLGGFSIDAGTFVYPFTFTLRDLVHKRLGVSTARQLILTAGAVNLVMALLFWMTARLPPDPAVGSQAEYALVLSPTWRIVLASIVAEIVAELTDTEVYRLWVERVTRRFQWVRVLLSNAISVPLDSAIFVILAFSGRLPHTVVWSIFLSNVLLKGLVTVLSLPSIYAVAEHESSPR